MLTREIEKAGIPVAQITAMTILGHQFGVHRVVAGVKIPHPCGDPSLPEEADRALRREIVRCALDALQAGVDEPTVFQPDFKVIVA